MSIAYQQQLAGGLGLLELRSPRLPEDLPLIWNWWTARHVGRRWSWQTRLGPVDPAVGHYTREQLAAYLARMDGAGKSGSNAQSLVGSLDGVDVCYLEVYGVAASPLRGLAGLCQADRGMHFIIGSLAHLGQGLAEAIGRTVASWQFAAHPDARHFVVEPSATNALAIRAALRAGGGQLVDFGEIELPHKRARVFAIARSAFTSGGARSPRSHTLDRSLAHGE